MSQDLGGFVGHRPRAGRTKFLQLLSAQEEDVLLRQKVSTSKRRDGTQCPHLLTLTGPDQLVEEQLQHSLTVEQAALFDEVLRLLTAQEDTWSLCHGPH